MCARGSLSFLIRMWGSGWVGSTLILTLSLNLFIKRERCVHWTPGGARLCDLMVPLFCVCVGVTSSSTRSLHFSPPRLEPLVKAQRSSVTRVPQFISEDEIHALQNAAAVVEADAGRQDLHKRQGAPIGSWSTVFLNHRLAELLPDLHERLFAAARLADATSDAPLLDERHELTFRCAEYHSVTSGGGIPMSKHHDFGSLLTLDLMLSGPEDFEGGDFCTLEADGSLLRHPFTKVHVTHNPIAAHPITAQHTSSQRI